MYSLRLRLFLVLLLVAVLAVAVVAFFANRGTTNSFNTYVMQNFSRDQQVIKELLASPIEAGHLEEAQVIADTVGAAYGRPVIIHGTEGDILVATETTIVETLPNVEIHEFESEIPFEHNLPLFDPGTETAYTFYLSPEKTVEYNLEPILIEETIFPINEFPQNAIPIEETFSLNTATANETRFLGSVSQTFWIAAITAVLLAGFLSFGLSRRILKPIEALTAAARQMEQGDLAQRVVVKSKDEIGTLSHAFNNMAASLSTQEQLRRNMVSDVAHELRTPLSNIRGYLEAVQDGMLTPNEALINSLHEESLLLNRLIDDLQELSLAEAGQLRLSKQPLRMEEVIVQAVTSLQPQAKEHDVALEMDIANNLPAISADRERIGQVLRNLIRNGIEHTAAGGFVRVTAVSTPTRLTIQIQDNGEGIPAEHLPHIFGRFYRVDESRSRHTGGTGLGLAISKALIEMHEGTIHVQSKVGQGTDFTISLPINSVQ